MTNTKKLIAAYIADKRLAWAPTTLKTAHFQLDAYAHVISGIPLALWNEMEKRGLKPYSRVTVFARVTDFYQWLVDYGHVQGPNPYKQFKEKNARQFKNVYKTSKPKVSYEDAREAIGKLAPEFRAKAMQLLTGGLRFTESFTVTDGVVTGKGGKTRECFASAPHPGADGIEYRTFLRALKKATGLKPHDLRKIFLNELVNKGANPFELCEVAGWSNLNTAQSYIRTNQSQIRNLVQKVQGGPNDGTTPEQVS